MTMRKFSFQVPFVFLGIIFRLSSTHIYAHGDYQRSVDGYGKKTVDTKPDEEYNGYGSVYGYGGYGGYGRLYGGYQGYGYEKRNGGGLGVGGYGWRLADRNGFGHLYGRYFG